VRQNLVEDSPEIELLEECLYGEGGSPGRSIEDVNGIGIFAFRRGRAEQEALEFGQQGCEEVLASELGDDPLFNFAVVAVGFDNADVLVDGAIGGRDLDVADVHEVSITTYLSLVKAIMRES